MNRLQRHVVAIALGAVCIVIAVAVYRVWTNQASGGWFMYGPESDAPYEPPFDRLAILRSAGVWLALIGAWSMLTFRLYRSAE